MVRAKSLRCRRTDAQELPAFTAGWSQWHSNSDRIGSTKKHKASTEIPPINDQ